MKTTLPKIFAKGHELDMADLSFGELRRSDDAQNDAIALRERFAEDGYLYVPGFFARADILEARKHIAQALVEVMSGARPAPQVIRWTTPEVYSVVARRNATSGHRKAVARRALVRRVRICEPVDGVVEACAVVVDNGRVRALAMRLTGVDRRWVVTGLQVG